MYLLCVHFCYFNACISVPKENSLETMLQYPEKVVIRYPLEELRCSVCKAYLSSPPILVLPDGNSTCGNCSSVAGNGQSYRHLKFEALLTNTVFPCRYKKHGCEERLVFGHVEEHEANCHYHTVVCPCTASEGCAWEGAANGVLHHFTEAHPTRVGENAEFQIAVDRDVKGFLIVPVNNVVFALIFEYFASSSNLQCDVRYFTEDVQEASYKIKLINNEDQDYYIHLKGADCFRFGVYGIQKPGLVLNNCLQILNNPNLIKVALDISVNLSKESVILDRDLLQTLRCAICKGYLIPPLFDNGQGAVCRICRKIGNCKPLNNSELNERVAKAHYPCYWKGCNVIARAVDFQAHVEACPFRIYECIQCIETFKRDQVVPHFESHGYEFFYGRFEYKILLASESDRKSAATLKNNGILVVQNYTESNYHVVILRAYGTDASNFALKVQFTHEHCKLKSKLYTLSLDVYKHFSIKELPACFIKGEELTVTLEVVIIE